MIDSDFFIPKNKEGKNVTYMCGHSLGLMPKDVENILRIELEKWANTGVEGHFSGHMPWLDFHSFATPHLAKLCGAKEHEVVAMGSLTNNIHLLLASFYKPVGKRNKILIEPHCFGSDVYALKSHLNWHGLNADECLIETRANTSGIVSMNDIEELFKSRGDEISIVFFPGVQYLTGQLFDLKKIADLAHQHGALAGFDLAHAIGNVPLKLNEWNVDFAVWCSYKYLNSGPGGVGGIFVNEKHGLNSKTPKLSGWWGNKKENRFYMSATFDPELGAEGWQLSNAPVLSLCAHIASLKIFEKQGYVENWFDKTKELNQKLRSGLKALIAKQLIELITPEDFHGAMISIRLLKHQAKEVEFELKNLDVICDARQPDIIRISCIPLFNDENDIDHFLECFKKVLGI
ncbi:MAG: kynureninase [Cytophagales bacterium]